jgi:hypothetical protein
MLKKICLHGQVSPSSPGRPSSLPAHKRLMREAEPTTSGHSGHTPKAQQHLSEHPDAANFHSTFDFRNVRARLSLPTLLCAGRISCCHGAVPETAEWSAGKLARFS